jgi:hypothetical protein
MHLIATATQSASKAALISGQFALDYRTLNKRTNRMISGH